jgi:hypothetical protein
MPSGRITKSRVDGLSPAAGEEFLWDTDVRGFGVKATAAGAKSYLIQYRIGGRGAKVRRLTIGRHGSPWTPETARAEAKRLLLQVGQGIDVAEARREKARRAQDLGFSSYVDRFVDNYLKERWERSWKDAQWELKRYPLRPIADIQLLALGLRQPLEQSEPRLAPAARSLEADATLFLPCAGRHRRRSGRGRA